MKSPLQTDLIGKKIKPAFERFPFNTDLWDLEPDLTGHFHAKIVAAWLDVKGQVMIAFVGPRGDIEEGRLIHYTLMLDEKDPGAELPAHWPR